MSSSLIAHAELPLSDPVSETSEFKLESETSTPQPVSETPEFQKWSGNSGAVFLGISPLFGPKVGTSDRLNTGNMTNFDVGLETKENALFGLRYASTKVPSLQTYNSDKFLTTYSSNASLFILESYGGLKIPLNQPYTQLGPVQLFIPMNVGLAIVSINAAPKNYMGLSVDSSAGVGARLYTKSIFRADLSALYHFGIPLGSISDSTSTATSVQSTHGDSMKLSLTGFELRLGVSILFPDSSKTETETEKGQL